MRPISSRHFDYPGRLGISSAWNGQSTSFCLSSSVSTPLQSSLYDGQRVECWPTASAVLQLREGVPFVSADLHSICCVRLLVKSLSSQ